jgi:PAS domain S-box-containing protein
MTPPRRPPTWVWAVFGLLSRRPPPAAELFDGSARMLLDLPLGVLLLLDDDQRILFANSVLERFLGYEPGEVKGRPVAALFSGESRAELTRLIEHHTPGDPTVTGEVHGLRKDGSSVPLQVVIQSAVTEGMSGSKVTGLYLRDFSERERLVDALATRGAALARSNRELEQFAYIASHDLQEPLRMVGSYTQLLEQRYGPQLDDDAREFLRFAREGATRMRELIDALLSYSRIDTRAQAFHRVPMDYELNLALANLREAIAQSRADVQRTHLPEVEGDGVQLVQVLQNLIGNAIKFRGPKPPHIWVGAERIGGEWRFFVRDDGIGIAPEYQDRIFILFQRLHTREEYPGTGIGLSVCKKVVERHGGRLWVESTGRPGEGSTFYFTLPVERKSVPAQVADVSPVDRQVKVEAMSLIEERLKELV